MSFSLSEHLPLLAEAPDGIKKLRGLILELAVRGKLVPQDPKDEPASELLKRITAEKARLVADGKIRKDKPLPPVGKEEPSFEAPTSWEWVRLGDVVELLDSLRKPVTKHDREPGPYPYYGASGIVDYVSNYIFDETLVLVGEDGAKWGPGENTAFSISGKTWVNNHAHVLRPNRSVLIDQFIVCTLVGMDLQKFITGMTVPKLNQARLVSIVLPIPPLAEQHRIVAKVDELMALCDRMEAEQSDAESAHATLVQTLLGTLTQSRDAAELAANWQRLSQHFDTLFTTEASLDALKQTVLQLAVMGKLVPQDPKDEPASELLKRIAAEKARLVAEGKIRKDKTLLPVGEDEMPFDLPVGWDWVRLIQLGEFKSGKTPSTNKESYWHGTIPWVSPKDMKGLTVTKTEDYVTDSAVADGLVVIPDQSVLVVVRSGILRRMVPVAVNEIPCTVNQDLKAFCLVAPDMAQYVQLMLRGFEKLILSTLTKVGTTVESIKFDEFSVQPFPLPPLAEQHRIVAKVDELMALCDSLKADLAESRARQARLATTLIESALQAA